MNVKTTVILLLIAAALVLYFLISGDGQPEERPSQRIGPGKPLVADAGLSPGAVTRITVERPREQRAVFERSDDGRWWQVAPVRFPAKGPGASGDNLGDIVDAALALRYVREVNDPDATEQVGPGATTVRIEGRYYRHGGRNFASRDAVAEATPEAPDEARADAEAVDVELQLKLGQPTAAGLAFIAFGPDDRVYVTGRQLHRVLEGSLSDFRQRSLASVAPGRVASVELRRGDRSWRVERGASPDGWHFVDGASGRAGSDAVGALIRALNTATIESFVADQPDDLATYGLDEQATVLTIEASDAAAPTDAPQGTGHTTHQLKVGGETVEGDQRYAMLDDRPVVFTLPSYVVDPLNRSLSELRDARLTPMPRSDLRRIEVERPNEPTLSISREAGRWQLVDGPSGFSFEPRAVDALLDAVFRTRARSFIPAGQLGQPEATVTLAFAGREAAEVIRIAPHAPDATGDETAEGEAAEGDGGAMRAVHRADEPVAGVVRYADLAPLYRPMRYFRDRTVLGVGARDIVGIRIERSGPFAVRHSIERTGGGDAEAGEWAYGNLRPAAVKALVDRLAGLRAERWVGADEAPDDASPAVTIEVAVRAAMGTPGRGPYVIELWPDRQLGATSAATPGAFALAPPAMADLTAELRDRTAIDLEVDQIAGLTTPAGRVIARDADGRFTLPDDGSIDEPRAGALFDTIAGLQVDRWFAPGIAPEGEPVARYKVEPRDGEAMMLELFTAAQTPAELPAGRIDGKLFTIERSVMKALVGE